MKRFKDVRLQIHAKEIKKINARAQERRKKENENQSNKQKGQRGQKTNVVHDASGIVRLLMRALGGIRDLANVVMDHWPELCRDQPCTKAVEVLNGLQLGGRREFQRLSRQTTFSLRSQVEENMFGWATEVPYETAFSFLLSNSKVVCCWSGGDTIFTTSGTMSSNSARCLCADDLHVRPCDCHHWLCGHDSDYCERAVCHMSVRTPPWRLPFISPPPPLTSIVGFCEEFLYALEHDRQEVLSHAIRFRFIGFCTQTWHPVLEIRASPSDNER